MNHIPRIIPNALSFSVFLLFLTGSVWAANTVTGVVYDNRNNPLIDVDVELLNDISVVLQHTRTDSGGRYVFSGLADGRYSIRVLPFRYDFQEASKELTFSTFSITGGTGSSTEILDFNLLPRKNGLAFAEGQVVFVQEVPGDAKKALDRARECFEEKGY